MPLQPETLIVETAMFVIMYALVIFALVSLWFAGRTGH